MSAFETWAAKTHALISDTATCDAEISRLLKTPQVNDVPRPGIARAWNFPEWVEWGAAWGLKEAPQTTHNFVLQHPDFSGLRLGMATSTGDTKSRMNMASDFRITVRAFNRVACEAVLSAIADLRREPPAGPDFESALYPKVAAAYSDGRAVRALEISCSQSGPGSSMAVASPTPLWSALYKQAGREKISPRQLLSRLVTLAHVGPTKDATGEDAVRVAVTTASGVSVSRSHNDYVEAIYTGISKGVPQPLHVMRLLHTVLRDYVDTYEILKDEEREAKAAAREASRANPTAAAAPSTADEAPEEDEDVAAALMSQLMQSIEALEAFSSVTAAKNRRLSNLVSTNDVLRKTIKDLQDNCDALRVARDTAFSKIATLEAERQAAQQLIDEHAEIKNWKPTLQDLVTTLSTNLSSTDFLALASGISHAKVALSEAAARLARDEPA
jgi:hypothetical protein